MKFKFEQLSQSYSEKKLLVVGDIILDAYIWGNVDRISPEAPVPVVQIREKDHQSGGAANVAIFATRR